MVRIPPTPPWLRRRPARETPEWGPTLSLVAATWLILAIGPRLPAGFLEPTGVTLLCFVACTALALRHRWARPLIRRRSSAGAAGAVLLVGALGGWAILPALSVAVAGLGLSLGWRALGPGDSSPLEILLASLLLAPIFEEIVYRERFLACLSRRIGKLPALVAASLAFALPHTSSWRQLGSAAAGIVLGTCLMATRSTLFCVGVHAGLNLCLEFATVGSVVAPPQPLPGLASAGLLLLAFGWAERAQPGRMGP